MFTDLWECSRSVIFDRKTFTLISSYFPKYLARVEGFQDESKIVCFLDKSFMFFSLGVALRKGSPLLSRLNEILTGCIEGGLLEIYWSRLKHKVNLKASVSDEDSEYVVFSLTHLSPIFIVLVFGYILSLFMFVIEIMINLFKINKDKRRSFGESAFKGKRRESNENLLLPFRYHLRGRKLRRLNYRKVFVRVLRAISNP